MKQIKETIPRDKTDQATRLSEKNKKQGQETSSKDKTKISKDKAKRQDRVTRQIDKIRCQYQGTKP